MLASRLPRVIDSEKSIPFTCESCGKECFEYLSRYKKKNHHFCSNVCYSKWKSGGKHHMWKGDAVGYRSLHYWVELHLGIPKACEECGTVLRKIVRRNIQWANKSGEYKRDLSDWLALCVSCHKKRDLSLKRV